MDSRCWELKKAELALIWVTGALICVLLGFFLGRNVALNTILPGPNDGTAQSTNPTTGSSGGRININTATLEQLRDLPGIGEQIANNIIAYREANGPFQSVNDLLNVDLIGESRLNGILDYISVID